MEQLPWEEVTRLHGLYSRGDRSEPATLGHRVYQREMARQRRKGLRPKFVDSSKAKEHLAYLYSCHIPKRKIARKLQIGIRTIFNIDAGRAKRILSTTEEKILALSPEDFPAYWQDADEAREHLCWLQSKGVGAIRIAAVTGLNAETIRNIRNGRITVTYIGNINQILGVGTHMFILDWRKLPMAQRNGVVSKYRIAAQAS